MAKATEVQPKFTVEYKDETGKLDSRWHYDYTKFTAGPILVEEFNLGRRDKSKKEKVARSTKST